MRFAQQRPRTPLVGSWALLAVATMLATACGVGERPTLGAQLLTSTTQAVTVIEEPASAEVASSEAQDTADPLREVGELGDTPPVLMSPAGIVLAVVGIDDGGYVVQTPCGEQAVMAWGQPISHAEVVLDPGHGGDERGAIGPDGETEAELNLDIARRAATKLQNSGVTVVLTRTGDYRIPIRARAAIADRLGASAFVSIHHNSPSVSPSDTPGTEVYVQVGSDTSRRLGGLVYEEVISHISVFDVEWTSAAETGVLTVLNPSGENAYGINRHPETPAILAELAYISNPAEATLLATDEYRDSAANALSRGIVRFLESDDPGSGFVEQPRLFTPSGATGGVAGCVDPILE